VLPRGYVHLAVTHFDLADIDLALLRASDNYGEYELAEPLRSVVNPAFTSPDRPVTRSPDSLYTAERDE